MGPGLLGGTYSVSDIRFATKNLVQKKGGVFVKDEVVKINPNTKEVYTKAGNTFYYDIISFNTGSYVSMDIVKERSENIYSVKPIGELRKAAKTLSCLLKTKRIVISVVGAGPASAEIADNV